MAVPMDWQEAHTVQIYKCATRDCYYTMRDKRTIEEQKVAMDTRPQEPLSQSWIFFCQHHQKEQRPVNTELSKCKTCDVRCVVLAAELWHLI